MTRRTLMLAVPQLVARQRDKWDDLADAWNPFAEKMRHGILDWKQWRKVVAAVDAIEGRKCKEK